ncbi:MAG: AzlD domain-containing protein [Chloroflexota bacterium]
MSVVWVILCMGGGVYALRLAGLLPRVAVVPPVWERAMGYVPIALLTALTVSSLAGQTGDGLGGIVAAAGGALVARLTGKMWACILSGMAFYWLLRLV